MFWTLASLAAAMTGTSAWLGWIDPSDPTATQTPSFESLMVSARLLVADDVFIEHGNWHAVEVLAGPAASGAFLTARSADAAYDFSIDADGHLERSTRWTTRGPGDADNATIRIMVARRDRDELMTRAQWYALRALTAALQEAAGVPSPIPVRLQSSWAKAYGLQTNTELVLNPPPSSPG